MTARLALSTVALVAVLAAPWPSTAVAATGGAAHAMSTTGAEPQAATAHKHKKTKKAAKARKTRQAHAAHA